MPASPVHFVVRPRYRKLVWLGAVVALLANALLFPRSRAAGLAVVALVACAGLAVGGVVSRPPEWLRRHWAPPRTPWVADALVVLVVVLASASLFARPWSHSTLNVYDWGPHHANLANLVRALRSGADVPHWVHGVSTGDSPYELYPALPYYLAAAASVLTGATDLTLVLMREAIVTHTLAAIGAGLLARRLVGWPWALGVGLTALYDVGSVWGGGIDGLFKMGVLHSALANALAPFSLCAVMALLARPSSSRAALVWAVVALTVACHPLGLVMAIATVLGLALVAALARDTPPLRAGFAIVHVCLGVLLVAAWWMPLSRRLTLYSVHFAIGGRLPWELFGSLLGGPVPEATLGPLVHAGYVGAVAAILSRRARPTLLAGFVAVLLAGQLDQLYVLLDLAPSLETARFQTVRLASVSKAAVFVLGIWFVRGAIRHASRSVHSVVAGPSENPAETRRGPDSALLAAVLALGAVTAVRAGLPFYDRLTSQLRSMTRWEVPDSDGLRALSNWAAQEQQSTTPDRYARLLHEEDSGRSYAVYHVNALSGLPTLWVGPVSCLFLRERIEDSSAESLSRFNVRWVVRRDRPPSLGDPGTQRRFGRYFVRELSSWDGHFARIERGHGQVRLLRLDDERVEVELTGTSEPALVALGMGYYPRWEAHHAGAGTLPTYALPATAGGKLRIVAAWLPPGRSTFSPTAALPSDGRGRWLSLGSAVTMLAMIGVWGRRASRRRALRALSRSRRWLRRLRSRGLATVAGTVAAFALLLLGLRGSRDDAAAIQVGNGLFAGAQVEELRSSGHVRTCQYSPLHGAFRCPGPVLVQDSMANLLNDAPPSPAFAVPAIVVSTTNRAARVRVVVQARLAGEYWAVTNGRSVQLQVSGRAPERITRVQSSLVYRDTGGPREVVLDLTVPAQQRLEVALVRRNRIDPDRGYALPPPQPPWLARDAPRLPNSGATSSHPVGAGPVGVP